MLALARRLSADPAADALPPIRTSYLYDRDGQPARLAARRGRPHHRAAQQDLAQPAARGDRHRGRRLLQPSRDRREGHLPRRLDRPREAGDGAGRLHAHRAAGEERLRRAVRAQRRRHHRLRRSRRARSRRRSGKRLLAIKLEQTYTKEQILAKYLNTVYFGHGAYGAEAAAQTYFGKPASELTVLESASLAGVLHAPIALRPHREPVRQQVPSRLLAGPDGALRVPRRGEGRDAQGAASAAGRCRDAGDNIKRRTAPPTSSTTRGRTSSTATAAPASTAADCDVTTSLDMEMQKAAWDAVRKDLPFTNGQPVRRRRLDRPADRRRSWRWWAGATSTSPKLNLATLRGGSGRQSGLRLQGVHAGRGAGERLLPELVLAGTVLDHDPDNPICNGPDGPWTARERRRRRGGHVHAPAGHRALREHRVRAGDLPAHARARSSTLRTGSASGPTSPTPAPSRWGASP